MTVHCNAPQLMAVHRSKPQNVTPAQLQQVCKVQTSRAAAIKMLPRPSSKSCCIGYLVEDDARVENKGGVKEVLQLPHQLICFAAPLHLHKGSNIASSPMLTLPDMHAIIVSAKQYSTPGVHRRGPLLYGLLRLKALHRYWHRVAKGKSSISNAGTMLLAKTLLIGKTPRQYKTNKTRLPA